LLALAARTQSLGGIVRGGQLTQVRSHPALSKVGRAAARHLQSAAFNIRFGGAQSADFRIATKSRKPLKYPKKHNFFNFFRHGPEERRGRSSGRLHPGGSDRKINFFCSFPGLFRGAQASGNVGAWWVGKSADSGNCTKQKIWRP